MTVAAIIVTYNRKEELSKAIEAIIKQSYRIDQLYIIDNHSTDGTRNHIETRGLFHDDWMTYIFLEENIGGAGGFHEGLKIAHSKGYDYYIMMDDDGRPINENSFLFLINAANALYKQNVAKFMLNAIVTCDSQNEKLSFGLNGFSMRSELMGEVAKDLYLDYINPFNGTLISKKLVDEIGYPNKDFFIRGDEIDYMARAIKANAFIATVVSSLYFHPTPGVVLTTWKNKTIIVDICEGWKNYYRIRNLVYTYKRDLGIFATLKNYIFQEYLTKKCNPDYENCKGFMRKGLIDGLKGKMGRTVEPGQSAP